MLEALHTLEAAKLTGRTCPAAIIDTASFLHADFEWVRRLTEGGQYGNVAVILVTSIRRKDDPAQPHDLGVSAVLSNPLRRRDVIEAVVGACAKSAEPANFAIEIAAPPVHRGHVLVAEDNPVNQLVAREYLAALGCTCEVVESGADAVAAFDRQRFDLILMDCQMPGMDGLTATRHIRQREAVLQRPSTPIIAITANAFAEGRISALASGMDAYLSKPYSDRDLRKIIGRWIAAPGGFTPAAQPDRPAPLPVEPAMAGSNGGLDFSALAPLQRSHPALLARMFATFAEHAPKMCGRIETAVIDANVDALRIAAHSLRSSSANVGAQRMSGLCRELERLSERVDLDQPTAIAIAGKLAREWLRVQAAIQEQQRQRPSAAAG